MSVRHCTAASNVRAHTATPPPHTHTLDTANTKLKHHTQQAGVAPGAAPALAAPLAARLDATLAAAGALRAAFEKTLAERLGAILDDTSRLRYEAQNGEALIDEIRAARGAVCQPPAFSAPQELDARVTGALLRCHHCVLPLHSASSAVQLPYFAAATSAKKLCTPHPHSQAAACASRCQRSPAASRACAGWPPPACLSPAPRGPWT